MLKLRDLAGCLARYTGVMHLATAEPINSYLMQCVVFMAVVPVVGTTLAILVAVRLKRKAAREAERPQKKTAHEFDTNEEHE